MIKQHWAQKVVKKASSIIKAEVLITNRGGQIIATSNPDRVGEVHQAARHSIERNLPIDIELEDMSLERATSWCYSSYRTTWKSLRCPTCQWQS